MNPQVPVILPGTKGQFKPVPLAVFSSSVDVDPRSSFMQQRLKWSIGAQMDDHPDPVIHLLCAQLGLVLQTCRLHWDLVIYSDEMR